MAITASCMWGSQNRNQSPKMFGPFWASLWFPFKSGVTRCPPHCCLQFTKGVLLKVPRVGAPRRGNGGAPVTHWLSGWPKKSPNFRLTTKMVFPKSLKFMNSGSQVNTSQKGVLHVAKPCPAAASRVEVSLRASTSLVPCEPVK